SDSHSATASASSSEPAPQPDAEAGVPAPAQPATPNEPAPAQDETAEAAPEAKPAPTEPDDDEADDDPLEPHAPSKPTYEVVTRRGVTFRLAWLPPRRALRGRDGTVGGVWIAETELTVGQYAAFVESFPRGAARQRWSGPLEALLAD